MTNIVVGRIGENVGAGASVPRGVDGCKLRKSLKVGNFTLRRAPDDLLDEPESAGEGMSSYATPY